MENKRKFKPKNNKTKQKKEKPAYEQKWEYQVADYFPRGNENQQNKDSENDFMFNKTPILK